MSEKKKRGRKAAVKKSDAKKRQKGTAKSVSTSNGAAPSTPDDQAQAATGLPVFYTRPEILSPSVHGNLKLDPAVDFSFASSSNAIPLNVAEFPLAAHHYPIVFVNADYPVSMAITGLRMTENIFVGKDGTWAEHTYIPAYARRYPFVFMRDIEANKLTLCIDRDSTALTENGGDALFDGNDMSEVTKHALDLCVTYQQNTQQSEMVGEQLKEANLLTPNSGTFTLPSGEQLLLTDFLVVDEQRLNDLSDAEFVKLRQNGALAAIYMHLASLSNWINLVQKTAPGT